MTIEIPINKDHAYQVVTKALNELGVNVQEGNSQRGIINASTSASLLSWGENIQVTIHETDQGVEIRVHSVSAAQLIDWGRNKENEKKSLN